MSPKDDELRMVCKQVQTMETIRGWEKRKRYILTGRSDGQLAGCAVKEETHHGV